MKNLIYNTLNCVGFFVGAFVGVFLGDIINSISLLPKTIDESAIVFCTSALLANTISMFFQNFTNDKIISSIIGIILNTILAMLYWWLFGFSALFDASLIIGGCIFIYITNIKEKK